MRKKRVVTRAPAADIYKAVGERIRMARLARGITGDDLGHALGISEQQALKYERGDARIPLDRLLKIAETTGVALAFFLEGLDADNALSVNGATALVRSTSDVVSLWQKVPTGERTHLLAVIRSAAGVT
jgi:transcriptional regulator with XRE-family HTH domain